MIVFGKEVSKRMSYLSINADDKGKEFVEELLLKPGYDVTEEPDEETRHPKASQISPTLLFGKWKDLDPVKYRKRLWARRKQYWLTPIFL